MHLVNLTKNIIVINTLRIDLMNINIKEVLLLCITSTLLGCGGVKMDMTKSKATTTSPSIYSATVQSLGLIHIIKGSVIKIDNQKITTTTGFKRVSLDPGIHTIEMTWLSSQAPIASDNSKVSATNQPLGYIAVSVREYTPKKNFIMKLRVREGYSYFVNLQDSILNNNSYQLPNRLCISEVKNNSSLIRVAPAGNVVLDNPVKILSCSK